MPETPKLKPFDSKNPFDQECEYWRKRFCKSIVDDFQAKPRRHGLVEGTDAAIARLTGMMMAATGYTMSSFKPSPEIHVLLRQTLEHCIIQCEAMRDRDAPAN
jgi:hypothetical protein